MHKSGRVVMPHSLEIPLKSFQDHRKFLQLCKWCIPFKGILMKLEYAILGIV